VQPKFLQCFDRGGLGGIMLEIASIMCPSVLRQTTTCVEKEGNRSIFSKKKKKDIQLEFNFSRNYAR
jgi:hypothetical protein